MSSLSLILLCLEIDQSIGLLSTSLTHRAWPLRLIANMRNRPATLGFREFREDFSLDP